MKFFFTMEVCIILQSLIHFSSSFQSAPYIMKRKYSSNPNVCTKLLFIPKIIPDEISSTDSVIQIDDLKSNILIPDNGITSINGAEELGGILWCFIFGSLLYDYTIPLLAKVVNQERETWVFDAKSGYKYNPPVFIDFLQLVIFLPIGYFFNQFWIYLLGGDSFWGWSTAMSVGIPVSLINVAREKKISKEEFLFNDQITSEFESFLKKRVVRRKNKSVNQTVIFNAFRISNRSYRDNEGILKDIELLDVSVDVLINNIKAVELAEKTRAAVLLATTTSSTTKPIEMDYIKTDKQKSNNDENVSDIANANAEVTTTVISSSSSSNNNQNKDWDDFIRD